MRTAEVVELEAASQSFAGSTGTIALVQIDLLVLRVLLGARSATNAPDIKGEQERRAEWPARSALPGER